MKVDCCRGIQSYNALQSSHYFVISTFAIISIIIRQHLASFKCFAYLQPSHHISLPSPLPTLIISSQHPQHIRLPTRT